MCATADPCFSRTLYIRYSSWCTSIGAGYARVKSLWPCSKNFNHLSYSFLYTATSRTNKQMVEQIENNERTMNKRKQNQPLKS